MNLKKMKKNHPLIKKNNTPTKIKCLNKNINFPKKKLSKSDRKNENTDKNQKCSTQRHNDTQKSHLFFFKNSKGKLLYRSF